MRTLLSGLTLSLVLCCGSCTDLDGVERDLQDLEQRIAIIRQDLVTLNHVAKQLQSLAKAVIVSSVDVEDGVYNITLSDGQVIRLNAASESTLFIPQIGIDEQGNWTVSYDGGSSFELLLGADGLPLSALVADGLSPEFGINEEGYWTVSYDGGVTSSLVLDEEGNPVLSRGGNGGGDTLFEGIEQTPESLVITLANGEEIELPIVGGFQCYIEGAGEPVVFASGEQRKFSVTFNQVVDYTLIYPEGWSASLDEGILSIQAPLISRIAADTQADVAVIATSKHHYSVMSKLQVNVQ